jgi:hypothetical protein
MQVPTGDAGPIRVLREKKPTNVPVTLRSTKIDFLTHQKATDTASPAATHSALLRRSTPRDFSLPILKALKRACAGSPTKSMTSGGSADEVVGYTKFAMARRTLPLSTNTKVVPSPSSSTWNYRQYLRHYLMNIIFKLLYKRLGPLCL